MGLGQQTAETRPAGALDAVLVPLNPGIPGIRLSPTTGAFVSRTHSTKLWRPLLLVFVLAGTVMIG